MCFSKSIHVVLGVLIFDLGRGTTLVSIVNASLYDLSTLSADDNVNGDQFGYSVGLSKDSNKAIVGAPGTDNLTGVAYIFEWIQSTSDDWGWVQRSKLIRDEEDKGMGNHFGTSVALEDDVALVGWSYWNSTRGKVYVYRQDHANSWRQDSRIKIDGGNSQDYFGCAVDVSGDTAVIGASGGSYGKGVAYIFSLMDGATHQITKLMASDGGLYDQFGSAVSISNNVAIVGAPFSNHISKTDAGGAYIFREIDGIWSEEQKLVADDGDVLYIFGYSVSIQGNLAIVGAPYDDSDGIDRKGAAYIFKGVAEANGIHIWTQVQKIAADYHDGSNGDNFGWSVGLSGSNAIVGAVYHDDSRRVNSGAAFIFQEENINGSGRWLQKAKLSALELPSRSYFGSSIASNENSFVIGAPGGIGVVYSSIGVNFFDPAKYSNLLTEFGYNNATLIAGSSSSFKFEFTNSIPGSMIHAAIVATTFCNKTNSAVQIKSGLSTGAIIGPVVTHSTIATLTRVVENEIDVTSKIDGIMILSYCLRADLYDDSDSSFSVGAKKVNLQLEITFENETMFNVTSIQTSEFVASDSSTSATRSVSIQIFKDSCSFMGCEIVDSDNNECFASDEDKLRIGQTLTLCLKGVDTDVDLIGIESAEVKAGLDYISDIVAFEEDGTPGIDNFVTITSVENGEVILETLLIPAYYDALDGGAEGSLEVSGTVIVQFGGRRRLGDLGFHKLEEKSKFSVNIPLMNPDGIPFIDQRGSKNSATMKIYAQFVLRFPAMVMIGSAALFCLIVIIEN